MTIRLNPYFVFEGKSREAIYFYEKVLVGRIESLMTFGELPPDPNHPLTDDVKELVMHAHLKVGDVDLMFSDTFPGMPHQQGDNVQISIQSPDEEKTKEIFAALEDGGDVVMPLQATEWSPLYGIVRDKFGVTFQLNVSAEQS
ncbi:MULTISPECIES: VOC family protein [Paenibacillus]|uniref:VOC family protein n=1 Tax=Paenibacillus TaxID=44249 RepID=UPI00203BC8C8|nr:VOC family protein [Paenibacillus camelliae]MCM3634149.1 VOC family protein [Paenibacillus camelliae]